MNRNKLKESPRNFDKLIMKLWVLPLTLILSTALKAAAPDCKKLAGILQDLEIDLNKSRVKDCKLPPTKTTDEKFKSLLCQDYSVLEAELTTLKLKLSVLDGIDKLKNDVKIAKEKETKEDFDKSLNLAHAIELLVTEESSGKDLLSLWRGSASSTFSDLKKRVCTDSPQSKICSLKIDGLNLVEIENFLKLSTGAKLSSEEIKNQLKIKRKVALEDKSFELSFSYLAQEYQEKKDIKSLPSFTFDQGSDLARKLLRELKKPEEVVDIFKRQIEQTRLRQQFDLQHKISALYAEAKSAIPSSQAECKDIKTDPAKLKTCFEKIHSEKNSVSNQLLKSKIAAFKPIITTSLAFYESLNPTKCDTNLKCAELVSDNKQTLPAKINDLESVLSKIKEDQKNLITMRNFALHKWSTQKCTDPKSSLIDQCEYTDKLSSETKLLTSNVIDIAIHYLKPQIDQSPAREICNSTSEPKVSHQDDLCSFFTDKTSNIMDEPPIREKNEDVTASLTPEGMGRAKREANRDLLLGAGTDLLKTLFPPPSFSNRQNNFNPYTYHTPQPRATFAPGISDRILGNGQRLGGLGMYPRYFAPPTESVW